MSGIRTVLLVCGGTLWALPALAQPSLTLSEPWFQAGATDHTWKYQVQLGNVSQETTFVLNLRLPEGLLVRDVNEDYVTSTSRRRTPFTEVRINARAEATITLVVTGPASDVQHGGAVEHEWRADNWPAQTVRAAAPERRYDPSLVRLVLGIGGAWLDDDFVDFQVTEDANTLLVLNDSRTRTAATVGALFNVPGPIDVLLSFDFARATSQTMDAVTFGGRWALNKYLSFGIGYSLRLGKELRPGFRQHAEAAVLASPEEYKALESLRWTACTTIVSTTDSH